MFARSAPLIALLSLAALGCSNGGGTVDPGDLVVAIFEGNNQAAIGNTSVATDPAVRVTEDGDPKVGVSVTFAVTAGGGAIAGGNATTDASGIARVTSWTLGDPGVAQELSATVNGAEGSPIEFDATATTGPPVVLELVTGNDQTATVGQAAAIKPVVRATDIGGNPVAGVALTWSIEEGSGSVVTPDAVTNANGTGTVVNWVFGQQVGEQLLTVHATCPVTCASAVFEGDAVAGPVSTIEKIAGDLQSALVSTAVTVPPRVLLKDIFGNLVTSRPVAFAVTLGGGAVAGATPTSATDGTAAVTSWTLGAVPGENRLSATIDGQSVTFTATATLAFNPAPFAGSYAGTWTNTTFASMGTGTAVITVNTGNNTATVTATATGNVLGSGGGATPPVQNGNYTANGAQFTGVVAPMGTINASIIAPGNITATGTNVPSASVTGWTATGTIDGTTIQLNFTVTFTAGPPAVGTITLTRQ
jgi:hypothetical protein